MRDLTPRQVVAELDVHIVGQTQAKRAVAIAVRNRWRRQQLSPEMRAEIAPKNILMIGPTGVGKTEIARRLAKLTGAPFIKVEATKYTEVGYYGRDVESIIRELVENAIALVRESERKNVEAEARGRVDDRLLDLLVPAPVAYDVGAESANSPERHERTREKIRARLAAGEMEDRKIEIRRAKSRAHDADGHGSGTGRHGLAGNARAVSAEKHGAATTHCRRSSQGAFRAGVRCPHQPRKSKRESGRAFGKPRHRVHR
jgi:ATP-dependent protease HslVU ATPase subunit